MALANKLQPAPGQPLPAQLLVQLQDSNAFTAWLQFVDPELNDDNLAALKSARLCSNAVFNVCQTEELLVTKLSKYIPEGSAMLIAAAYFKLRSASGPLLAQPSDKEAELVNALERLSLNGVMPWIEGVKGGPKPFEATSDTSKWFTYYVRHDVINELGKLMRSDNDPLPVDQWPTAASIINDSGGQPTRVLREFLKRFQDLKKLAETLPQWQAALSEVTRPDYSTSRVSPEWEYLRALSRSSLLDIAVYEQFRSGSRGSLAAKLPKVDEYYAEIVARNEATFTSTIPTEWKDNDATKRYLSNLQYYSELWHTIPSENSELELTGGPLSDLFDHFFRYVPPTTLFAGKNYGAKFANIKTFFTRGTQDTVQVDGLIGAAPVLPDGRFVLKATVEEGREHKERDFSLVYIEDKKKSTQRDESAVMYADRKTVLLEAQRSLLSLVQFCNLSPTDSEKLCIPAVHTKWPKIWMYGVSYTREGVCVTKEIAQYDGLDTSNRPALSEMCLRILLLLKKTLDEINNASKYNGKLRVGQLTVDAKHASDKSPTSGGSPGFSPAKPPDSSQGRGQHGGSQLPLKGLKWHSESVCVETLRCVWKLPTRNKEEKQILQLIGGRHCFAPVLDLPPSVAPPVDEAFALPYLPDRSVRSIDEARLLTANLAEALAFLHSLGYVHCDVKRSNVRFTGTKAYLIDLDSARQWRSGSAPLRGAAGTPMWRAPEACADDGSFTNKVDLYGLGLVLFDELLCLYFPDFWRVGEDTLDTRPTGIYSLLSRFAPPTALELLCSLVSADPAHRPEAAEVLECPFIDAEAADHVKNQQRRTTIEEQPSRLPSAAEVLRSPFVRHQEVPPRACQPLSPQKSQRGVTQKNATSRATQQLGASAPSAVVTNVASSSVRLASNTPLQIYRDKEALSSSVVASAPTEHKNRSRVLQPHNTGK